MQAHVQTPAPARYESMRYRADPLADDVVARILGDWNAVPDSADREEALRVNARQWQRLAAVNRLFGKWQDNASLRDWRVEDPQTPPDIAALLEDYVRRAQALPAWADAAKIERAEQLFLDFGVLSCLLLCCASLPECYVVPDMAAVLQTTGQLQDHAERRIRATAAMVFPVMMPGGLTASGGSGIAQILKVRLIHATIRNLLLRGNPQALVPAAEGVATAPARGRVLPLAALGDAQDMQQVLFAHGWDLADRGLPCNQEEQAYTLLTFNYIVLRSLRQLGIGLPRADEEAYLHAWNVMGHVLGLERELMADTMEQAEMLFSAMKKRGLARHVPPDSRPALTAALMQAVRRVMPVPVPKAFPVLMTRYLCSYATARDLGLNTPVSWLAHGLFNLLMGTVRVIDTVGRRFAPNFSISRLLTRLLSERLMAEFLLSQTRQLQLPQTLRGQVESMLGRWRAKSRARG